MKTITRNGSNISLYLFEDSEFVQIADDVTTIGNPPVLIVNDCNSSNATLFEDVSDPVDWDGWKYFYTPVDGWVLNPDWVPPTEGI
jgi:hypothetical protein